MVQRMSVSPEDCTPTPPDDDAPFDAPLASQRSPRASALPSAPLTQPEAPVSRGNDALETDRYREIDVIGHGGSGVVIRALDKDLLRHVAIKIFDPSLAIDESKANRFIEEARITGQLEHPSIVPIYELGVDDRGRRFLAMKLIGGATLDAMLTRLAEERLAPVHLSHLLQILVKVCDAVSFAHSRGVLHLDLKPTNIMVSDFGQVYVLDWGIARLSSGKPNVGPRLRVSSPESLAEATEVGAPAAIEGTVPYMAPEQLRGQHDRLDQRTDVFALGATLYQILTGQPPPLPGGIAHAFWMRKEPPAIPLPESVAPAATLPPELSRIAMRALSYDPADRYASVTALTAEIETFQRGAWDVPRLSFPAGTVVVAEGQTGDAAYVILQGHCVAYRVDGGEEIELRRMGPGDVFGETAVFSSKPRTANVRALTDVVLLSVTGEILQRSLGLNSWMGAFVKALADRFREADLKLRELGAPDSRKLSK
jgi:serine/threonine-protein kinase